ncbi:MAG: hypothetical protein EPO08_21290 [Rhodospirillaceae bacterium]|nr:MAG: hypothetical protein EPO08_21290 [Rhodospirillaceae bacterium]
MTPKTIEWPEIILSGRRLILRLSYAANYQLARWGRSIADGNTIELAAAMAGEFLPDGRWRSAGFERPIDLADLMEASDELVMIEKVTEAVKKAYPELEVSARQTPETTEAPILTNAS